MCYDDIVQELSRAVKKHVKFTSSDHALSVAKGRTLPMNHEVTRFVYEEAQRLYDKFTSPSRPQKILQKVGIANADKGRQCVGTKLSAIREAIYQCAELVAVELAEEERRASWPKPRNTTDVWLDDEQPKHPETARLGDMGVVYDISNPDAVASLGEVCATS